MLSICIPIYNRDVEELVVTLHKQITGIDKSIELILIDDASDVNYQVKNKQKTANYAKYIQLDENIGRSRIRNLFLKYAKQPFLIFLDCDVTISRKDFVKRYYDIANENKPAVVCGGHHYSKQKPSADKVMRWKFGVYRESPSVERRMAFPYKSFKTSNFMVYKELFESVNFNESIKGYGHEDTLFGYELKQKGIPILHIDNSVFIKELDTNEEFLEKTHKSIDNLINIRPVVQNQSEFINDISLLKAFWLLKRVKMIWLMRFFYRLFSPIILRKIIHGDVSLKIFDLYKLGYISEKFTFD